MKKWTLSITDFLGGFAPAWYLDTYPSYGNKNMAGDMQNVDLMNPACLTQGPGLSLLTPTASVTTLVRGILDGAVSDNKTFAVGGSKFYEIAAASAATAASPTLPHTISGTSVEGEDLAYYKGAIYYSYSTNASANVGMYDLTRDADTDFNDAWGTSTVSATVSAAVPLPLEIGGNDYMYLGQGNRISSWDGTTWTDAALDLPNNVEIQDIKWNTNRLWAAVNQPDLTGNNRVGGSVFVWDGASSSWEEEIRMSGRVGGMFVDNGVTYVFYQDISSTGGYKLGYLDGIQIKDLASFKGSLPQYYQITKYKGFILWVGGGLIYAFGAADKSLPSMTFQLADGGLSTVGGLACPFGTPMVASHDGSSAYQLAKFSDYDTSSYWKSLMFAVGPAKLRYLIAYCDTLGSGAQADFTITTDRGANSYTTELTLDNTTVRRYEMPLGMNIDSDFRVEVDFSNGSTSNPVKINRIEVLGDSPE